MFRFKLDIAGEVQMDRGISRFADGVADYRPVWGVIEDDFYALEKDQFKSEGAEGGEAWQELSPEYAKWKEAHFPGKPILERAGVLETSLTSASGAGTVRIEERKTLTLGSSIPYAIYHQSIAPRVRLPRRPEINLTEAFKRTVMHHIQVYLVEIATRSGFRQGLTPTSAAKAASYFGVGMWPGAGQSPVSGLLGGLHF
jgi:phage gpG-like protein